MKPAWLLLVAITAFLSSMAVASDFRFCDMEGTVQKATLVPGSKARTFDLVVFVSASRVEKGERGELGYTDCSEFLGETVEIRLHLPETDGEPGKGDFVAFNYSAIDGFGSRGEFIGTYINAALHEYRKIGVADER